LLKDRALVLADLRRQRMLLNSQEALWEVLNVMSWSKEARKAFREKLADWQAHGSPPIPLGVRDTGRNTADA
jgi:hypothetical protein